MARQKLKLLVANRSEIACRVFQAARELDLTAVALLAPGDEEARHVTYADEVIRVSSYLNAEEIVRVAKSSGVSLIHPGYGFLSERSHFAKGVEEAGMQFLGPRAETIDAMGEKTAAKDIATAAQVPTLPWARVAPGQNLKEIAKNIGYPILLKAAAGGGGKGMRKVAKESELEEAAEGASREAKAAFGDGTLFIEKLLENPRHIEVQVFGDGQGGAVHLYERECSLQRRHQKIWEEARAPNLSDAAREKLYAAAIRLTKHVKYRSAGTLEFLVDAHENFYFLEMNTRLQVEHPVSELVTGIDLVWAQIHQALDPSKPALKEIPSARGHAIETRIIAEDAAMGFVPTPGKVTRLHWPTGAGIRVDSGIEEGQTIGTQFDSMCAKLIVYGETREQALARLKYALNETVILGLGTNQAYLLALLENANVRAGKKHTGLLAQELGDYQQNLDSHTLKAIDTLRGQKGRMGASSAGRHSSQSSQAALTHEASWSRYGASLKP